MTDRDSVPDEVKASIQQAYSSYIQARDFKPRYGQRLMIATIARALCRAAPPRLAVIEAGTGTGKTIAYLLSVLPIAKAQSKRVVLATATVALQAQVVEKDLPDLSKHSSVSFRFSLAKGRGRYLCVNKLEQLLDGSQRQQDLALYEDEVALRLGEEDKRLFVAMADDLVAGRWNGDRDSWPGELADESWSRVTTDHRQCSNRRCQHFSGCVFFKARAELEDADLIVANHDLVLADLSLGGGALLPEPEETLYIFDEGHHLSDKAIKHFSHQLRLYAGRGWLEQLQKTLVKLGKAFTGISQFLRHLPPAEEAVGELLSEWGLFADQVEMFFDKRDVSGRNPYMPFSGGLLPESLSVSARQLATLMARLIAQLDSMAETLTESMSDPGLGIDRPRAELWYPQLGRLLGRAEGMRGLLRDYADNQCLATAPQARWLAHISAEQGEDIELCSSPVLAAEKLTQALWERCSGAVVTSATLSALGRFDHFCLSSGVPQSALFERVPSPFDYGACARLRVPALANDPSRMDEHDKEVADFIRQTLGDSLATLVIFTSWRQMRRVHELIEDAPWLEQLLMQGNMGKQAILDMHRSAIDSGLGSVIFGLASFAEGVDLPGYYLRRVVIAKIPFSVPDDPVEQAMNDWVRAQGRNPFEEIAVPKAAVRLIQACGRLIRSETDEGEVIILDTRLRTRRYGRAMLDSLPPFKRIWQ